MSDVIIIGSGPSGCTAAIYVARAGYKPLVLGGSQPGGQLMTTTDVENFPGFPEGVMGPQLCMNFIAQAERFGTEFKNEIVTSIEYGKDTHKVITDDGEYSTKAIIVATGSAPRLLKPEGFETYWGKGISTCATCDGFFFKDKVVSVIGGGDTAMEEAAYLAKICTKVYLIHRREEFRASQIMVDRCEAIENIEFKLNQTVSEFKGDGKKLAEAELENTDSGAKENIAVDACFIAIGHTPNSAFLGDEIEKDAEGYLLCADNMHTNIPGVFVGGDVGDTVYRQAITAAGMGCKAGIESVRYLEGLES